MLTAACSAAISPSISPLAHTVSCSESFPCKDMRRLNFYTCCLLMTMVLMLISAAWSVALCCCGSRSNAFKRIVAHLPAEDKAKLFYGNASRLYRLGEEPKAEVLCGQPHDDDSAVWCGRSIDGMRMLSPQCVACA